MRNAPTAPPSDSDEKKFALHQVNTFSDVAMRFTWSPWRDSQQRPTDDEDALLRRHVRRFNQQPSLEVP